MLIGRYEEGTGRPYLDAWVDLPDLGQQGWVPFVVDTGADLSMIGPDDCQRLLLPPSLYDGAPHVRKSESPVIGIGGVLYPFLAKARLTVLAASGDAAAAIQDFDELGIVTPEMTQGYEFASVLGWDFFSRLDKLGFFRREQQLFLLTSHEVAPWG